MEREPEMQRCLDDCLDCHVLCLETVTYCLEEGGTHAETGHLRLLLDCAEICQTNANYILRRSNLHLRTCRVCTDVCDRCGQACEEFDEDAQMKACAESCRRCEQSCRQMTTTQRAA
jgi:hypothetical protein